jgi:hypothetical protein
MIVLLIWWSVPLVFLIVLLSQARNKSNKIRQRSAAYALSVYIIFTIIGTLHIFSIRSSTAGIGLLFLPLYALVPAGVAYVLGYFHGRHKEQKLLGQSTARFSLGVGLCTLMLTGVFGWQYSEIRETTAKNTANDIKKARRNADIRNNKERVRWMLADNKGKEAEKLNELASETTDDTMLLAIAGSRYAQEDLLDRLSRLDNLVVTLSVVRNKNTAPKTLQWIYQNASESTYFYSDLARNSKTPEIILREIYGKRHTNGGIAWSLASNESTPIDVLKKLANERDENVHRHLKKNKAYIQTE